jgi:hypothetical protein
MNASSVQCTCSAMLDSGDRWHASSCPAFTKSGAAPSVASPAPSASAVPVMAYLARHDECGGVVYVGVDTPDMKKSNAKEIGKCIRKGYSIEHITVEAARIAKFCMCNRKKRS